jgi:outer membrane protein assembly factor BamA
MVTFFCWSLQGAMNRYILLITFFSFTSILWSGEVSIDCLKPDRDEQIAQHFQQKQKLASLSFDVDFSVDEKELCLLTGLKEGQFVDEKDLRSAAFYLQQKSRFSSIDLEIAQVDEGVALLFRLTGGMIFSKVRVHGYITGKYKYKNAYILSEGDRFDISKHDHSLQNMKKIFHENGYFKVKIKDHISYDYHKKVALVDIYLERNSCCKVHDVSLKIEGTDFDPFELQKIKKRIDQSYCAKLKGKYCSKKVIEKYKEMIERFLYRRGLLYSSVDMKVDFDDTVRVVISIELNRKKEFVFFGNHYFNKQDFLESLLLYGKSAWHFPSAIISDELRQMYHNKGFWEVDISTSEESGKIFCVIHEGKRVRIVGVEFQGIKAFSDEDLAEEAFQGQVLNKLFDKKLYDASKKKMLALYKSYGYWDAFVEKEEFQLLSDYQDQCIILLQIDEGKQRLLRSVSVPGHEEVESDFKQLFDDEEIVYFDYALLTEQKIEIIAALKEQGYANIEVSYQLNDADAGGIDLVWEVRGDNVPMKFGKPVLVSNAVVSYSKLSREFTFKKGDVWDLAKIDETANRLRNLGIFDSVQIYPGQTVDSDNERPVLIKVVDADKFEARLRVGLQQVGKNLWFKRGFTHKIGGSFLINNPFKVGDAFALHGDFTQFYGKFSAQYLFPWLFRLPIRSEVKIYNNYYNHPVYFGSNVSLYRASQQGLLFGATRNFEKYSFGATTGFEFMGLKEADVKSLDTVIDYSKELLNKKTAYFYLEPSIVLHRLDNLLNPSSGYRSMISCKAMFDFDTKTSYFKLIAEQALYMKIMSRAVVAVRGRIGHLFNQKFNELIPLERFYLGGVNSIRGYYRDYCPPLGLLTDPIEDSHAGLPKEANNLWKYAPQGGRTMISLNGELRLNLYQSLDAAVFTDFGALFKDTLSGNKENLVGGAGFGLRYNTPVGPIRFDIAWKWRVADKEFEPSYIWYLTLGQAF